MIRRRTRQDQFFGLGTVGSVLDAQSYTRPWCVCLLLYLLTHSVLLITVYVFLGFYLCPNFAHRTTTHLLCPSREGAKFSKALEWGTPVVGIEWIEKILRDGVIPSPDDIRIQQVNGGVGETDSMDVDHEKVGEVPLGLPTDKGKGKEREVHNISDITNSERLRRTCRVVKYSNIVDRTNTRRRRQKGTR